MHFDLAHAVIAGLLIFGIIEFGKSRGWDNRDWRTLSMVVGSVFILNILWPA